MVESYCIKIHKTGYPITIQSLVIKKVIHFLISEEKMLVWGEKISKILKVAG